VSAAGPHIFVRPLAWAGRHPRFTLPAAAVWVALAAWGASRIRPAGSLEAMLAANDPAPRALARVMNEFGIMDDLIVLATVPEEQVGDAAVLDRLRSFGERLDLAVRQSPHLVGLCTSVSFRGLPEIRRFIESEIVPAGLFYLDEESLERLAAQLTTDCVRRQIRENEELISTPGVAGQALAKLILRDPLRLHERLIDALKDRLPHSLPAGEEGLVLSTDRRTLMIRLTGARPAADLDFAREFTQGVRSIIDGLNTDRLQIEYTGAYAIATTAQRSIRGDMKSNMISSFVMLGLLFLVAYRHWLTFPVAAVPVAIGIVSAFGLGSFYSTQLTPVVAVIGAVLAGLAIDYGIHYLAYFRRERENGVELQAALAATSKQLGPAIVFACSTSMAGFLAIVSSSVPALRQFAVLGSLGLGCSLLATLTVLPALLQVCEPPSEPRRQTGGSPASDRAELQGPEGPRGLKSAARIGAPRLWERSLVAMLRWVDAHAGKFVTIMGLTGIVSLSAFLLPPRAGLEFNSDLTVMHPQPNPPLDAQRGIARRFGRDPDSLIVLIRADSPEQLVTLAHTVERRLKSREVRAAGVSGMLGLTTLLPDPAQTSARALAVRSFDVEYIVADLEKAVAESIFEPQVYAGYIAFLRKLFAQSEPPDILSLLRYPQLARLLLPAAALKHGTPMEAIQLLFLDRPLDERAARDAAIQAVRRALDGVQGAVLTGVAVVGHDTEAVIRRELSRQLMVAVVLVVLMLAAHFRRIGDTALALLPVSFGFAVLLGLMNLLDLRLNLVNLIGLPILFGVGVDNGIFLVSFARARAQGGAGNDLLTQLGTGCHALLMTTLTTLLSFGTLAFTSTPAIRSLGVLLTIGMTACLAGTFLLLAPILMRRPARSTYKQPRDSRPSLLDS